MAIKPTDTLVRAEALSTAPVDNGLVMLNLKGNNYVILNDIGKRIWELLESPIHVTALSQCLENEFQGAQAQIMSDLLVFLDKLEQDGLVLFSGA